MEAVPWTLTHASFATTGARVRAAAVPHHNPRSITRLQQVAQQRQPFAAGCSNKPLQPSPLFIGGCLVTTHSVVESTATEPHKHVLLACSTQHTAHRGFWREVVISATPNTTATSNSLKHQGDARYRKQYRQCHPACYWRHAAAAASCNVHRPAECCAQQCRLR